MKIATQRHQAGRVNAQSSQSSLIAGRSRLPAHRLQTAIGNAATARLLNRGLIQPKLSVSQPDDEYEREADRVADQVMRVPDSATGLQRKCDCGSSGGSEQPCENCASHSVKLQRRVTSANHSTTMSAPAIVHDTLGSPGRALDRNTRVFFEKRFGHDFSSVRIHTDQHASRSAEAVNALAYTVGNSIVFGAGRYSPDSTDGKKLLAHELTHVVQQGGVHRSVQRAGRDRLVD